MKHKYVQTKLGFITWPMTDEVYHSHVGRAFERSGKVISAGFAEISDGKVRCYGMSESLGIGSLSTDSSTLAAQLGLQSA